MYLGKNTNVLEAARIVINDYCIKSQCTRLEVAEELGITKGTLDNKLKGSMPNNSLTLDEAIKLTRLTGDNRIMEALCSEVGLVAIDPIEAMPDGGDIMSAVVVSALGINKSSGNLSDEISKALEDGVLDENEKKRIVKSISKLKKIASIMEMTINKYSE